MIKNDYLKWLWLKIRNHLPLLRFGCRIVRLAYERFPSCFNGKCELSYYNRAGLFTRLWCFFRLNQSRLNWFISGRITTKCINTLSRFERWTAGPRLTLRCYGEVFTKMKKRETQTVWWKESSPARVGKTNLNKYKYMYEHCSTYEDACTR